MSCFLILWLIVHMIWNNKCLTPSYTVKNVKILILQIQYSVNVIIKIYLNPQSMPMLYVTSIAHHGSCDTYLKSLDLVTTQAHNCLGMAWVCYLCISELILDIFVRICRLTHDPGSNERIYAVMPKPMQWLSLNCVCYLLLKCILWHMPVSMCCWMVDGVRILSENCHSWNLWGHEAIKFALT